AKKTPEDILIQISACNRGSEAATLHLLPTLWFRNTWFGSEILKPVLKELPGKPGYRIIGASHQELGNRYLYCEADIPLLFTENETNNERVFGTPNASRYLKDGVADYLLRGKQNAINSQMTGTKVAAHYKVTVGPRSMATIWLRLSDQGPGSIGDPFPK